MIESRTRQTRDEIPPTPPEPDSSQDFPDGLFVKPILDPDDIQKISYVRTVDARTALARGMSEYLSMLSMIWEGGRQLKFARTKFYWAEPEEQAILPAAALIGQGEATYEDSTLSQQLTPVEDGTNRYLYSAAAMMQRFRLEAWSSDPVELYGLSAMIEDALEPTDFMTGLRLELPYYFNARATYEKQAIMYGVGAGDAHQRWRKAIFTIVGTCPQYRPVGALQLMDPKIKVSASDSPIDRKTANIR